MGRNPSTPLIGGSRLVQDEDQDRKKEFPVFLIPAGPNYLLAN